MPNTLPRLHIRPITGWLNDPNGVVRRNGRWHVFYQANPSGPVHGDIEWGHVSSADLIGWEHHPTAFRPTPAGPDSGGCWTGVSLPWLPEPAVAYSGVVAGEPGSAVCVREALDTGLNTWSEPRVVARMPQDVAEMRDPFCFAWGSRRLAIVGAQLTTGEAAVLLYDVADAHAWRHVGVLLRSGHLDFDPPSADIWECPQLVIDGDRCWLIVSRWVAGETLDVIAFSGAIADRNGLPALQITGVECVDAGDTFYAPQVALDGDDAPLLFGWVRELDPAASAATGVSGCLTLPRRVDTSGGTLRFAVDRRLQRYADEAPVAELDLADEPVALPGLARVRGRADRIRLSGAHRDTEVHCPVGDFELWTDGEVVEVFPGGAAPTTLRDAGTEHWRLSADEPSTLTVWRMVPPPSPAAPPATAAASASRAG